MFVAINTEDTGPGIYHQILMQEEKLDDETEGHQKITSTVNCKCCNHALDTTHVLLLCIGIVAIGTISAIISTCIVRVSAHVLAIITSLL